MQDALQMIVINTSICSTDCIHVMNNVYLVDQVYAKGIFHVCLALCGGRIVSHFSHPYDYLFEIAFILEGGRMQQSNADHAQIGSVGECMLPGNADKCKHK